ncbi:MAG TPA: YaaA family protein [Candidatus Saccharimonadales bacterium]|nr:YaaA family protein [Candidatus Saccharimonadales bacterium]
MSTPLIILLHSSKTMRTPKSNAPYRAPQLVAQAVELDAYLKTLTPAQLAKAMHLSAPLAAKTHRLIADWSASPDQHTVAMDSFVGDIYSGLRASELSAADREYADRTLCILSGLYGVLRPYDSICPYRLEMGYIFPNSPFANLYTFWGDRIAKCLPAEGIIVNASSLEYSRTVTAFVDPERVITPKFLTFNKATGEPAFVVVHAKIARGAFARWLITSRTTEPTAFAAFTDLGYRFDAALSTPSEPVFVCQTFGGIGLSMRLALS